MKSIKLKNTTVRIYDSIDELPVDRFHRFNKYVMIDAGIGGDMESVDQHLSQIARMIKAGKTARAEQKIENLRQNLYFVIEGINPASLSFAVLIHDIDGKELDDLQEESLMALINKLGKKGLTTNQISEASDLAKKKFRDELETLYPQETGGPNEIGTLAKIKQRALLVAAQILGEDKQKEIDKVTNELEEEIPVERYTGTTGREAEYEREYENMCLLISPFTNSRPADLTTKQFYALVHFAKNETKKKRQWAKRKKR